MKGVVNTQQTKINKKRPLKNKQKGSIKKDGGSSKVAESSKMKGDNGFNMLTEKEKHPLSRSRMPVISVLQRNPKMAVKVKLQIVNPSLKQEVTKERSPGMKPVKTGVTEMRKAESPSRNRKAICMEGKEIITGNQKVIHTREEDLLITEIQLDIQIHMHQNMLHLHLHRMLIMWTLIGATRRWNHMLDTLNLLRIQDMLNL
ncbi:uncharacterized protein LOC143594870 [Bidens hawaiensis]